MENTVSAHVFTDDVAAVKMDKNKGESSINDRRLEPRFLPWSPIEENKFLLKQRYISCSKSVPRLSKRFVQYRLSRSLNSDLHIHSPGSENSSFEETKYMSRSAKMMRALNVNSSPSYYGKTKTKKSFNLNSTPSPKRFMPVKKGIRKALSLSFTSPLSISSQTLDFENEASSCTNNSLAVTSPESMDENQNETPSQQNTKRHKRLHYSTPTAKLNGKTPANFTPLLRSRLKETIDNILYITATPNSHSLKYTKGKSKCSDSISNTSRNLFHEFHDADDDRPQTPENFVHIVPESMSAIKRSHKKERSRRLQSTSNFPNDTDAFENAEKSILSKHTNSLDDSDYPPLCNSEDDISETGSLFDYTEEQKNIVLKVEEAFESATNCDNVQLKSPKHDAEMKLEENLENLSGIETFNRNEIIEEKFDIKTDDLSVQENNSKIELRSVTPELTEEAILESDKPVTPENRINVLQIVANDSIKKSRKKNKGESKKRVFSSEVLPCKLEVVERKNSEQSESFEEYQILDEQNDVERPCTPEKINSSRLLLSQYSSVKKSHKKDKHNKILSGFLKRQEYFNREINFLNDIKTEKYNADDNSECRKSMDEFSSNLNDSTNSELCVDENTINKLSPSKRKLVLDMSIDRDANNVPSSSEAKECDTSKEEFKIFTPLKRKRKSLAVAVSKEVLHFYNPSSGKDEISEEVESISLARCLTPVSNVQDNYLKSDECRFDDSENMRTPEMVDFTSKDLSGRLTPRNMSTVELYSNLDSIKRSHKKNKRGACSKKSLNALKNNLCDEKDQNSAEDIDSKTRDESELSDHFTTVNDISDCSTDKQINRGNLERSVNSSLDEEHLTNANVKNSLPTVTPPNCLKTKNYIKLLRETSIKRSHKKVRDKRRHNSEIEAIELSDDGSIFGDEDKSTNIEDESFQK